MPNRHRSTPWAYPALLLRHAAAQRRIRALEPQLARAVERCGMYELWYRSGVEINAGLQGELNGLEEQLAVAVGALARLEALAERDAPMVSGWKTDLDEALADLERARAEKAALEVRIADLEQQAAAAAAPGLEVPAHIATYHRVAAAAGPPANPAVIPLQHRNAS